MLIKDLLGPSTSLTNQEIHTIRVNCSQFIEESCGSPLFKSLPSTYGNCQRVKARLQKKTGDLVEVYNRAFESGYAKLRQRAIFAYSIPQNQRVGTDNFYIFPTNGFKYLYCKEVADSSNDYQHVIDTLFEQVGNSTKAIEIVADLLKYTYLSENLYGGIVAEAEIIVYNIPQYYAIRASVVQEYSDFVSHISK